MTTAAHWLGFAITTFMWFAFWTFKKFEEHADFTKMPHPGEHWRGFMLFCTLVGICFVLLAYR